MRFLGPLRMFPYSRQQFDARKPLFARRDFTFNDRQITTGDAFEVGGVPSNKISELWSQHMIDHEPLTVMTEPAVVLEPAAVVLEPNESAKPTNHQQRRDKRR